MRPRIGRALMARKTVAVGTWAAPRPAHNAHMTRAFRRFIARLLIGVVLFAQFTIAAHACALALADLPAAAGPMHDGTPCAQAQAAAASAQAHAVSASAQAQASRPTADPQAAPPAAHAHASPQAGDVPAPTSAGDAGSSLCAGHCQLDQQSTDPSPVSTVGLPMLAALYVLPAAPAPAGAAGTPGPAPRPRAGSSPPLAILHCCPRD